MELGTLSRFEFHADTIIGQGGRHGNLPIAHVMDALHGADGFDGCPYFIRHTLRAHGASDVGLSRRKCVDVGHISRVWANGPNRGIYARFGPAI